MDARLVEPVIVSGFDRFTLVVGDPGGGKHEIRIATDDRFLNRTETAYRLSN